MFYPIPPPMYNSMPYPMCNSIPPPMFNSMPYPMKNSIPPPMFNSMPDPFEFMRGPDSPRGEGINKSTVMSEANNAFNDNLNNSFNKPTYININNHFIGGSTYDIKEKAELLKKIEDLKKKLDEKKNYVSKENTTNYDENKKINRITIKRNISDNCYSIETNGNYKFKGTEKRDGKVWLRFSNK